MGKPSRDKGARVERELVAALNEVGLDAKRVPLSGAARGFKGDIIISNEFTSYTRKTWQVEVKARKDGSGFKTLEAWLGDNDFLFLKRNNADPIVVMSWDSFLNLREHPL